jgi:hypothetical protein
VGEMDNCAVAWAWPTQKKIKRERKKAVEILAFLSTVNLFLKDTL